MRSRVWCRSPPLLLVSVTRRVFHRGTPRARGERGAVRVCSCSSPLPPTSPAPQPRPRWSRTLPLLSEDAAPRLGRRRSTHSRWPPAAPAAAAARARRMCKLGSALAATCGLPRLCRAAAAVAAVEAGSRQIRWRVPRNQSNKLQGNPSNSLMQRPGGCRPKSRAPPGPPRPTRTTRALRAGAHG
jgi:hypothetical protein